MRSLAVLLCCVLVAYCVHGSYQSGWEDGYNSAVDVPEGCPPLRDLHPPVVDWSEAYEVSPQYIEQRLNGWHPEVKRLPPVEEEAPPAKTWEPKWLTPNPNARPVPKPQPKRDREPLDPSTVCEYPSCPKNGPN